MLRSDLGVVIWFTCLCTVWVTDRVCCNDSSCGYNYFQFDGLLVGSPSLSSLLAVFDIMIGPFGSASNVVHIATAGGCNGSLPRVTLIDRLRGVFHLGVDPLEL